MDEIISWILKGTEPGNISFLLVLAIIVYKLGVFIKNYFDTRDKDERHEYATLKLERDTAQSALVEQMKSQIKDLSTKVDVLWSEKHSCEKELAIVHKELEMIRSAFNNRSKREDNGQDTPHGTF